MIRQNSQHECKCSEACKSLYSIFWFRKSHLWSCTIRGRIHFMFWKTFAVLTLRASALLRNPRLHTATRALISSRLNLRTISRGVSAVQASTSYKPKFRSFHLLHKMSGGSADVAKPIENFRSDYKPCGFSIPEVSLSFELDEAETIVFSRTVFKPDAGNTDDLVLHGEDLELLEIKVNGQVLSENSYKVDSQSLRIARSALPETASFTLESKVRVHPDKNFALSGLYKSGSSRLLSTQCEAMGFRRITYHLDRPDVLSVYTVRLAANKEKYPILLSNGNEVDRGEYTASSGQTMHFSVWEDPFPKPCYLFAIVAGDLGSIHSSYTTTSGRMVKLGIYSDKENANQLDHAMYSLKASMKWDEDTFGLGCDLDTYNIVATNDFNMGAMENKGLNIFSSAYTLADPNTATDNDFEGILGVIGHEYFHNWTGNRVTVRDWFQLTLKEGLTVFRYAVRCFGVIVAQC
jgi:aminopeptidase N